MNRSLLDMTQVEISLVIFYKLMLFCQYMQHLVLSSCLALYKDVWTKFIAIYVFFILIIWNMYVLCNVIKYYLFVCLFYVLKSHSPPLHPQAPPTLQQYFQKGYFDLVVFLAACLLIKKSSSLLFSAGYVLSFYRLSQMLRRTYICGV